MAHEPDFVLPTEVVSRVDVLHINHELENLNDHFEQRHLRQDERSEDVLVSAMLLKVAKTNHLDLKDGADRQVLTEKFKELKNNAPDIHISFGAEAPPDFTDKLVSWLRQQIHPLILLNIGLEPTIAAGCVVRTTNKFFDFSVGQNLQKNREKLVQRLQAAGEAKHG